MLRSSRSVVLVACLVQLEPAGLARLITVGAGQDCPTISSALEQASPGDVIRVFAGVYEENVVISQSVVLEGVGRPVIRGDRTSSVVTVQADRVTVRGFRIERSGLDPRKDHSGILLRRARSCRIENNELVDILFGIYLLQAPGALIQGNRITGRGDLDYGQRGNGIHLWNSHQVHIVNNEISACRDGLYFEYSNDTVVEGNHVWGLRYGLHYMFCDRNTFSHNIFEQNVAGAAIMYSQGIRLVRNSFVRNRGFSSYGILFQACRRCRAEENFILDNAVGISMEDLGDSEFSRNTIAGNDVAIQMFSSARNNRFWRNNFLLNLSPMVLIGGPTNTQWCVAGAGNYWSEYKGYDLDLDGVGDVPFRIQNLYEHLEGAFPRLRLFFGSPAAQAMAVAEQAFPILSRPGELDPCPLMRPVPVPVEIPSRQQLRSSVSAAVLPSSALLGLAAALWTAGRSKRRARTAKP